MEGLTLLFSGTLVHPCVHNLCGLKELGESLYQVVGCYDLFPFLLIYFLFCLSLCTAPCLVLFAFLCACFIAYLCVVLGHILHDT